MVEGLALSLACDTLGRGESEPKALPVGITLLADPDAVAPCQALLEG